MSSFQTNSFSKAISNAVPVKFHANNRCASAPDLGNAGGALDVGSIPSSCHTSLAIQ